ncbi:hypothetical protein [Pedobacter sp. SL55]|uniref:hypothetical protein n=1 Tax=Pedobacter sp. SL55 TaxID=2995161 RepID=UPI00226F2352|nr:hypothetical protein [Pedobacter sp. SL55]WAC38961.1 hypothetical protein OVA16_10060 [Pedobacter sp. SL55]
MSQADDFKNNRFNLDLNEIYFGTDETLRISEISKNQVKFYLKLSYVGIPDPTAPDYLVMILE